ncbi:MAG: hypothetical protein WED11_13235 [Natronospirillum sp.]
MSTRLKEELLFILALLLVVATSLFVSADYPFTARLMPQVVAVTILILLMVEGILTLRRARRAESAGKPLGESVWGAKFKRTFPYLAWLGGLYIGVFLIGLLPAAGLFTFAFSFWVGKLRWWAALLGTFVLLVLMYVMGDAFNMRWPVGYFFDPFR